MTAPAIDRGARLTDREVQSLRRMIGYRPEWSEHVDERKQRSAEVVVREQRMREWFAAEGIDPQEALPRGTRPRAMAALGIGSVEAFDWSMRSIRARTDRADRPKTGRPRDPVIAARAAVIGDYFTGAGVDPLRKLPRGAIKKASADLGLTYLQVEYAVERLREAS
ncbi:hypothetical protein ACXYTP_19165 [Tsukamurella ocularis]|uniref:hypothetical protein n=1 Tax=Tsukamurella ocularis TaxID=1970234 RepID=UPI0039EFECC7